MVSPSTHRGLGVTAGLDAGFARELAAHAEQLGYHSLWSNDEPAARGLDTLGAFAAATATIELGVGVLPLHRYQPAEIAAEVDRLGIDPARLWLGIGSGALAPQIDPLQRGVAELRALLPEETRIVLAAMRPRLCRLGGAVADGVLLNWMLPGQASADGCVRQPPSRGAPRRSLRPTCGSPWAPGQAGAFVRRRASIAPSTRAIGGTSKLWLFPSGAWGSPLRSGPTFSRRWPRTTLRSTFRSCGCPPTRTRPRSAPSRTRQRHRRTTWTKAEAEARRGAERRSAHARHTRGTLGADCCFARRALGRIAPGSDRGWLPRSPGVASVVDRSVRGVPRLHRTGTGSYAT